MGFLLDWCQTAVLVLAAAIAALYASRGQNLTRNALIAAILGCWAAYRLYHQS